MLYSADDAIRNQARKKRELMILFLGALPLFILVVAGFAVRLRWLACAALFLMLSWMIFMYDMRVGPLQKYGHFLSEIQEGLSHDTRGVLVRIGESPVFTKGVYFREIILNIYKDRGEDGERRFLLDCGKEMPDFKVDDYVVIHSHGVYILGISPLETDNAQA